MTDKNYVKNRLDDQIDWYSKNATKNKSRFHGFQIAVIIIGAIIPLVNLVDFAPTEIRIISSILGVIIVGVSGILQLKKYHENWISYRSTEEALKKEKYTYENNAGEYSGLDEEKKLKLLVENVESTISNQNVVFFITHKKGESQ